MLSRTKVTHCLQRWQRVHHVHQAWNPVSNARLLSTAASSPEHNSNSNTNPSCTTTDGHVPPLVKIPALPFVGSTISIYSKIPPINKNNFLQWWAELHDQCGDFYQIGLPGIGNGLEGTAYVITDPNEMMKVLKQEGTHPSGIIESHWSSIAYHQDRGNGIAELFSRGEGWKRYRSFLQKDLLAPQAAREHLPGLIETAQTLSSRLQKGSLMKDKAIMEYLNLCALDMFTTVLFGSHLSKNEKYKDIDHDRFRADAVHAISESLKLKRDPWESFLFKNLGIMSTRHQHYRTSVDSVFDIGFQLLTTFQKEMESGKLDKQEMSAYVAKALKRQGESDLSVQDVNEICTVLLAAAVDTTSGKLAWNLLQLALNPQVQQRLYEEIDDWVQKEGALVPEMFSKTNTPILHGVIRETHRITPAGFVNLIKEVQNQPVQVNGVTLQPGSVVVFDSYNPGRNPDGLDRPDTFLPDRWLPDAVEARKGSPAEIIDHPFFAGPFSQGARRCPGSRVAHLEVQVLLAQLILDWKLELPPDLHIKDIDSKLETTLVPVWPDIQLKRRQQLL